MDLRLAHFVYSIWDTGKMRLKMGRFLKNNPDSAENLNQKHTQQADICTL